MKKIGSFIWDIVIGVWLVLAIFVTICLLSYNKFGVSTFGKTTLLIIDSDEMEPNFLEGDLLVLKRGSDSKINIGDQVFYYNSAMNSTVLIYLDAVQEMKPVTRDETTYLLGGQKVSGQYVIGKASDAKIMHKVGSYLQLFTSRWGFMFLVIFPTLFAIMYEIMLIIEAARESKEDATDEQVISQE